jgi:hypothetical protein
MLATVAVFPGWAWFRRWAAAGASLVSMLLTGAFQILPALEYGRLAMRWTGEGGLLTWNQIVPYLLHATYDLKATSLFGILIPGFRANFDPFIGVLALTLAALAVARLWSEWETRWLFSLGLASLLYSLGHQCVIQGLLYSVVPQLNKARSPSAAVVIMQLAAAALAARGIDLLLGERDSTPWPRRLQWAALGFGTLVSAVCLGVMIVHTGQYPGDDRVIVSGLVALLVALLIYGCRRGAAGAVALALLLMIELGNSSQYMLVDRRDDGRMTWLKRVRANADVAAFLRKQPGFPRAEVEGKAFAENWGSYHGVDMFRGELASVTTNILESGIFDEPGKLLFGVGYTLAPQPKARPALPRAWSSHELVRAADRKSGFKLLAERLPAHDLAYLTEAPPAVERCAGEDQVQLTLHEAERIQITAQMACSGMVVLSDTFYPGWRATLDGTPARIYETDGALRGVVVPAGSHHIEMDYRPGSVFWGAGLTLVGLMLACGAGWTAQKKPELKFGTKDSAGRSAS